MGPSGSRPRPDGPSPFGRRDEEEEERPEEDRRGQRGTQKPDPPAPTPAAVARK